MPTEEKALAPDEESRRIESEAATEILRMLTSDWPDSPPDEGDRRHVMQRSLRQDTTMWF